MCNNSTLAPLLDQYKNLFKICPGSTNVAEHFIPTTCTLGKVPLHHFPAYCCSKMESQIQMMLEEGDQSLIRTETVKDAYPMCHPDKVQDRLSCLSTYH